MPRMPENEVKAQLAGFRRRRTGWHEGRLDGQSCIVAVFRYVWQISDFDCQYFRNSRPALHSNCDPACNLFRHLVTLASSLDATTIGGFRARLPSPASPSAFRTRHRNPPRPPQAVTVDSPALEVMTDLKLFMRAVIEPQASMESANHT